MKKIFIVLISCVLVISCIGFSVSAEDYVYTPKQLFGNVTQAFVTGSDGTLSQQDVYSLGDYGYGMLPFAYPIKNFEMQFTFQIDTDVTTNDYIIFSMNFDRVTYGYQFSFITYSLYVLGGGALKEQSFSFAQRNNEFQFQGFSTYNGEMSIEITFTYADVGVSEEEYYFSDIGYFKGPKENAPLYSEIDRTDQNQLDGETDALKDLNENNLQESVQLFSDPSSSLSYFNDGFNCVRLIFENLFDRVSWLRLVLYLSLMCGVFGLLFEMGGVISRWVGRSKK